MHLVLLHETDKNIFQIYLGLFYPVLRGNSRFQALLQAVGIMAADMQNIAERYHLFGTRKSS